MKSVFFVGRKKVWIVAAAAVLFVFAGGIVLSTCSATEDEVQHVLGSVEEALGAEWRREAVTEVTDLVYGDPEGNNIICHVCVTTYYDADANGQTGLNMEAIAAVIDPGEAESCRGCTVGELPAAVCKKDGRAYLCWTVTPELSYVIEYDPAAVREEDIFRMAESVLPSLSR